MKNITKVLMFILLVLGMLSNWTYAKMNMNWNANSTWNSVSTWNSIESSTWMQIQVKQVKQTKVQNNEVSKENKLQELKQRNEDRKVELKQRLKGKLEIALNNKFQAIEKMDKDKQTQIYTRIRTNINKLNGQKEYTWTKALILEILWGIIDEKLWIEIESENEDTSTWTINDDDTSTWVTQ